MKVYKKYSLLFYIGFLVLIFFGSFLVTKAIYGTRGNSKENKLEAGNSVSLPETKKLVSSNTVIELKIKNSKAVVETKNININDIKNDIYGDLTAENIKKYYEEEGYKYLSGDDKTLVFEKEIKYIPNKFYLGATKDGLIAVFKCDSEGNLIIQDTDIDISTKNVDSLPKEERQYIMNYQYVFNSKDDAVDELAGLCS